MRKPGRLATTMVFGLLMLNQLACEAAPAGEPKTPRARTKGSLQELAQIARERRLSAAFLIVDGVYNTELTAPYDVLQHTLYHAPNELGIEPFTVSPDGEVVTTSEGLRILPHYSFENAPPTDILVVPSAEGSRGEDLEREDLIAWVGATGRKAGAVMSLCWGAFILAQAGLLDDAACTTFPSDYDTFSARFPELDLRINVSFVESGKSITSQGGANSFDAAMHLVYTLYGEKVTAGVGGGLLIPWPPTNGSVAYLVAKPN